MANKGWFCLDGYLKRTERLTDEELGRLFRACMIYHATGEEIQLDGRESVAFDFIRQDIDTANEAYEAKCEQNRRNRTGTTVNDCQRPSTTVNENQQACTNGPNIKEKENTKENNKEGIRAKALAQEAADARFERFWAAYPRHVDKKTARDAFARLNVDDALLETILVALAKWSKSDQWQEDGGRFIPHPTTWLRGRRWEDEVPSFRRAANPAKQVSAQQYSQRDYSGYDEQAEFERTLETLRLMQQSSVAERAGEGA